MSCLQAKIEALLQGPVTSRIASLLAQPRTDELELEAACDAEDRLNAILRTLQPRCVCRRLPCHLARTFLQLHLENAQSAVGNPRFARQQ